MGRERRSCGHCVLRILSFLLLLLLLLPSVVKAGDDSNSCGCLHLGACESDGSCTCSIGWSGTACEVPWRFLLPEAWTALQVDVGCALFLHATLVVSACYQLFITLKYASSGGWVRFGTVTYSQMGIIVASTLRVVYHAVDPFSFRGILSFPVTQTIISISPVIYFAVTLGMVLHWVELQQGQLTLRTRHGHRIRIVLLSSVFVMTAIILPLGIVSAATSNINLFSIFFLAFVVIYLAEVTFSLVFGLRMFRMLKGLQSVKSSAGQSTTGIFLRKLTWYLFGVNGLVLILIISMAVYAVSQTTDPRHAVALAYILTFTETPAVALTLAFLWKRPPKNAPIGRKEGNSGVA